MILATRFTFTVEKSWKNMYFQQKMASPPATYDVIFRNHSNWPSLCARDERTATENVRCWVVFILSVKTQKNLTGGHPPTALVRPRVKQGTYGSPKGFLIRDPPPTYLFPVVGCNILTERGDGEGLNILSQYKTKRFEKLTLQRTVNFVFASLLNKIHVVYIYCLWQFKQFRLGLFGTNKGLFCELTILHNFSVLISFISILISTYYDNFFGLLIIFGLDDPGFPLGWQVSTEHTLVREGVLGINNQ